MEELRRLREEKGWSQTRLAQEAGVDRATINQVEGGRRSPTISTLEVLAAAMGVEVADFFPKAQAPLPDFNGQERRERRLSEVADELLMFGHHLLLTWEAELPDRARADDDEWLGNIVAAWRMFGKINYDVLDELGADGLRDKQGWLARYMDVNAAIHRINAAIQEHSAAGASPDEEATVTLEPLVVA